MIVDRAFPRCLASLGSLEFWVQKMELEKLGSPWVPMGVTLLVRAGAAPALSRSRGLGKRVLSRKAPCNRETGWVHKESYRAWQDDLRPLRDEGLLEEERWFRMEQGSAVERLMFHEDE